MMGEQPKDTLRNKLFISYGTIIGFIIFALVISIFIILEVTLANPFSTRLTSAFLGLTIIIFLLGVIVDQLKFRYFRFWALGAIVSFSGVLLLFSPIIFYGFDNNDVVLWVFLIIVGILLIIFGYTIEAYELNNKVAKILINLWENIRNFQWKKIPKRLLSLIGLLLIGIISYIALGFRKFRYVLKKAFSSLFSFMLKSFNGIIKLLIALPGYFKKFLIFCYEYNYWLLIPLFFFSIFKILNLPFPTILFLILVILLTLLVVMQILNSNAELSQRYLQTLRNRSWGAVQSISIRIQKTTSSIGKYKCTNCNKPLKLGQAQCENCSQEVKHCSICKLPIKNDQQISTCSKCLYPAHTNHWNQWIRMNNNCPVCKQ